MSRLFRSNGLIFHECWSKYSLHLQLFDPLEMGLPLLKWDEHLWTEEVVLFACRIYLFCECNWYAVIVNYTSFVCISCQSARYGMLPYAKDWTQDVWPSILLSLFYGWSCGKNEVIWDIRYMKPWTGKIIDDIE